MPQREQYAQPPIEILRFWMGHGGWYDRKAMEFRKIIDIAFVGAMGPPGGGRQPVTNRFLRYFNFVAFPELEDVSIKTIYQLVLKTFVEAYLPEGVLAAFTRWSTRRSTCTTSCARRCSPRPRSRTTPSTCATSPVMQGAEREQGRDERGGRSRAALGHENMRVYRDRLVNDADRSWFDQLAKALLPKHFALQWDDVVKVKDVAHLVYGDYMVPGADPRVYTEITDTTKMVSTVEEYLEDYNATAKTKMPLVMFVDAVGHVSRISRVIRQPQGNALLLGPAGRGGSRPRGSRRRWRRWASSRSRLRRTTARASGATTSSCSSRRARRKPTVFLFSDTQIVNESFVEDITNTLNTARCPTSSTRTTPTRSVSMRPLCQAGLPAQGELYSFVKRVRKNIHISLCFSPMGEPSARRATSQSGQLLHDRLLRRVAGGGAAVGRLLRAGGRRLRSGRTKAGIVNMCGKIHQSVEVARGKYEEPQRRFTYVTPTSYLELLGTFKRLLVVKREEVTTAKKRLVIGLDKLESPRSRSTS